MKALYITSALKPEQLPPPSMPELAVVGRSNAGKSTLINALTGQKALARTGKLPGTTVLINFFSLDERCFLVDLPGYGHREVTGPVEANWGRLMDAYLERRTLQAVLFLSDFRRKLDDTDLQLLDQIQRNAKLVFLMTKTDRGSQSEVKKMEGKLKQQLNEKNVSVNALIAVSGRTRAGVKALKTKLGHLGFKSFT